MVEGQGLAAPLTLELPTPRGPARAHIRDAEQPRAALVLGHGAGGGVGAPDLVTASQAALGEQVSVALVEQPYRVAGRRSPAPAPALDASFTAIVAQLMTGPLRDLPVLTGGRSSGARVACRTASATGARGVVCLAFPLLAPRRRDGTRPSRLAELDGVEVPVLVVQGTSDPFGMPPPAAHRRVVEVPGDHSLRKDRGAVAAAVAAWLRQLAP